MSQIEVITFDLWDTIVYDGSDEPKRQNRSMRSKQEARRHLLWEKLNAIEPIPREQVNQAFDVADAAFNTMWKDYWITWPLNKRLKIVLDGLGRSLPPETFNEVVEKIGTFEVEVPPETIEGIEDTLKELSHEYNLAIVSDAIFTPGSKLRALLEHYGLKSYFSSFAFSDEVGRSKPHKSMFTPVAAQFDIDFEEILHIGDRIHNDVRGAQIIGAQSILFTAAHNGNTDSQSADAVCNHHHEIPKAVEQLNRTKRRN